MNWNKAIAECPSNKGGKCKALRNNKTCAENIKENTCPIKQLETLTK